MMRKNINYIFKPMINLLIGMHRASLYSKIETWLNIFLSGKNNHIASNCMLNIYQKSEQKHFDGGDAIATGSILHQVKMIYYRRK